MLARPNSQSLRFAALLIIGSAATAGYTAKAQANTGSTLPATSPTAIPQASNLPAPIAARSVNSSTPRKRAHVTYNAGLLNVEADNSSLNGILRDIAQVTGMKITGGVADQRVFGNYGPAVPSTVLATLLDGTGSNMLLKETADRGPAELILTPRSGGPTPPSAMASSNEESDEPMQQNQPAPMPNPQDAQAGQMPGNQPNAQQNQFQPANNVLGSPNNTTETPSTIPTVNSVSTDAISTPSTATPVSGIVDSTNPPPAGSTGFGSSTPTQPAANAAPATPEQIYQQLQKIRQAAQQQSGNGSTVPAATTPQQ